MRKKSLLFILLALIMTMPLSLVQASGVTVSPDNPQKGLKLSQRQLDIIKAVHPWADRSMDQKKGINSPKSKSPFYKSGRNASDGGSVSNIMGWRNTNPYEYINPESKGWYQLGLNGEQRFQWTYEDPNWIDEGWNESPDLPFNVAFYRNGIMYGFHSEIFFYWLIWGKGSFTTDGEILSYEEYGTDLDLLDCSSYVLNCAYDPEKDIVYAYTLNPDATGYMLQSVNPETWEFKVIKNDVPIEDICIGFAYNPADKNIYGLTPDGRFVAFDRKTGKLTQRTKYPLPVNTTIDGMVYSPLDKCFAVVIPAEDYKCDLYTIDPLNPELKYRATLDNTTQYRILMTTDKLLEAAAPLNVDIESIEFDKGSRSGIAKLRLPEQRFDGEKLNGTLLLKAAVDGKVCSEFSCQPGELVEINYNDIEEGIRVFSFTVWSGEYEGASVDKRLYIGFDTPLTPAEIVLKEGFLEWNEVAGGINCGYIDAENLTYNIYLNGEKINAEPVKGTSFSFKMPDDVYKKYVAEIEADNHGYISGRGVSNSINFGNPFPLPVTITPTESEGELIEFSTDRPYLSYEWRFYQADYMGPDNYFGCYTTEYDMESDEWLLLPAVNVPASDNLLEVSFDFLASDEYTDNKENIAVAYGPMQSPEGMKLVKKWDGISDAGWRRFTAYCPAMGEVTCIGLLTTTHLEGYNIRVKEISIRLSDRPSTIPAEVESLKAIPHKGGELKADVYFRLPVCDAIGESLKDKELSAVVITKAGTVKAVGKPGEEITVSVPTVDGFNTITVYAANSSEGLALETQVFTGYDLPAAANDIAVSHTKDYKGLHLQWSHPTEGENGGYIDSEEVGYKLCLYNDEEWSWEAVEDLGHVNECDVMFNIDKGIAFNEVGLLTYNRKGDSTMLRIASGSAGIPYRMPMEETFASGEQILSPMVTECLDEDYTSEWGYTYTLSPYWIEAEPPFGNGGYVARGVNGDKCRMVLPAFNTLKCKGAGIEIPLYAAVNENEVRIFARAFGIQPEEIGTYKGSENNEWERIRFTLPDKFMNREWVEILIDGNFKSDNESVAAFGQYKIKEFLDNDLALTSVSLPAYAFVGDNISVKASVENNGTSSYERPEVGVRISKGDKLINEVVMTREGDNTVIPELGSASFSADIEITPDMDGTLLFTVFNRNADMDSENDSLMRTSTVGRGNKAVVTDLAAEMSDQGINLTWTDPTVETGKDSFEGMPHGYFGETIGEFKTLCLDGLPTTTFIFDIPQAEAPKGWQVISESEVTKCMADLDRENDIFTAVTGDKLIMAVVPASYISGEGLVADRWIISPEVKGGSEISFMISAGQSGYVEPLEVLYSSSDDNPESFVTLDETKLLSAGWKSFEYELPEDARYFAIRYKGNTDESSFVMIDDIEYTPVNDSPRLEGYDIYRNGVEVAEMTWASGEYLDRDGDQDTEYYQIVPVVRRDGTLVRGMISNKAYVRMSGVTETAYKNSTESEYYTLQGLRVKTPEKGVIIKKNGTKTTKILKK